MSFKTRTGLTETTPTKPSPPTPRLSKLSRTSSKSESNASSPLQASRLSIDRSPHSVNSKPAIDRRSPKLTAPTEKSLIRSAKGTDQPPQVSSIQEDLRKANEKIDLLEKEKCKALEELKQAQKAAEETKGKLEEALTTQKRAQEDFELEKFRNVELEQAKIEAIIAKEEEWKKEIESMRTQHAVDISALFSTTEELQKAKQDLAMVTDAKNHALSHADDATRIAEIHAEKAEFLSAELARHKTKIENDETTMKLREEIELLNQELITAKGFEEKVMEKDGLVEKISVELEAAKMAESYAHKLAEEWKRNLEQLEIEVKESGKMERSASESLNSVMKQLEESNDLLHEAENEIESLKEKVGLLEMTVGRQKANLEESEKKMNVVKGDSSSMAKELESLKAELESVKEERTQSMENEKLAASSVQILLEEKNKLITDIEIAKVEEEKSKKAMEDLASALHEVSGEARETKERLLSIQVEHESNESQIEDLKVILKSTNEKYEALVDEARKEMEEAKNEVMKMKTERDEKEKNLVDSLKKCEEHNVSLEKEIDRLVNLLRHTEEEACGMREEEAKLQLNLKGIRDELIAVKEEHEKLNSENLRLKESILDKETELQNVFQENEDLRMKETAALHKVEQLSKPEKLLDENGDFSESEVVEFPEANGHSPKQENEQRNSFSNEQDEVPNHGTTSGKEESLKKPEGDSKMWESCQIEKKEYLGEREVEHEESVEEEKEVDQLNGLSDNVDESSPSPSKQQSQKKKKPLLHKFGSLLKKKGSNASK